MGIDCSGAPRSVNRRENYPLYAERIAAIARTQPIKLRPLSCTLRVWHQKSGEVCHHRFKRRDFDGQIANEGSPL
jgi:hypothetical protein